MGRTGSLTVHLKDSYLKLCLHVDEVLTGCIYWKCLPVSVSAPNLLSRILHFLKCLRTTAL